MANIINFPNAGREIADHQESDDGQFNTAFPLSAAQERIWRADDENPGDPAYNCAFRWSFKGALDVAILERAFNEILSRHEILRASFKRIGTDPVQLISAKALVKVILSDLRPMPPTQREVELERICREEATKGFDIGTGPLIRITVVQLEEQHCYFLLTIHLLIADGWSIRLIMKELIKLYSAFSEGRESPLPPPGLQYPDYVIWQRERVAGREYASQLTYWKSKLANYQRLDVVGDLPPRSDINRASAIVSLELPRDLLNSLTALSQRLGGTMYTTVFAACAALLSRYTGSIDVALGSELAGRNRTELEGLVGHFVNHVVVRVDLSGNPSFLTFAESVRNTVWEIFANQDVAFEDVIEARKVDGENSPSPFFLVNFDWYGKSSGYVLKPSQIEMVSIPSISQGAFCKLNFFVVEREAGWRLSLQYNNSYFSEKYAWRTLKDLRELLNGIIADPERRVSEFELSGTTPPPQDHTPVGMSKTVVGDAAADDFYALPASAVQERFWLLAKLDPSSPKFNMRANVRLKGELSQKALEASFRKLVERHEILRTTFAEQDGQLVQVIATKREYSLSVVSLADMAEANREERLQLLLREEARHHFNLQHGPLFRARLLIVQPSDFVLIIATHHIISDGWSHRVLQDELWSVYEALAGNRQPLLSPLPIQYADFSAWQNDWLNSAEAAGHLNYWLEQLKNVPKVIDFPTDHPPALKMNSNGGIEFLTVSGELIRALRTLSKSEGVTMFTLTLACFAILIFRCSDQEDMVIGSPMANRRPETEPLIGPFAGPIPFRFGLSHSPTLRDVLKHVSEVSLEALDHSDLPFEVLLRKLRVQSVNGRTAFFQFYFLYQAAFLQPHILPSLAVTPLPAFSVGTPFELQLALIERQEEVRINLEYNADLFEPSTIKALLQYYEMLLRAMASDLDQHVAKLAAPAIRDFRDSRNVPEKVATAYVAPVTDDEIKLTEIWKTILNVPTVGTRDNFFELGGHSLLAAQLVSQVQAQFGITIDLSLLLVAPTIEQLAVKLPWSRQKGRSHIVPIREGGAKLPLFCIHGAGGHLLDYREFIESLPDDQPVYGLRASDLSEAHSETVEELADQYLLEIQKVQERGPYQLCGLSFGGLVAYEIARQLIEKGQPIGFIALFDTGNWAYYRNLPAQKMEQFRRAYMIDRLGKYGRNLIQGRFDELAADARQFVMSRLNLVVWKVVRRACWIMNRPVPKIVRSNVVVFSAAGQNYVPRAYPGRLLLFRAEGRTAEYGDDLTLGWTGVAQDLVVRQVPGGHLSILRKPHVDSLIKQLAPYMVDAT